MRARYPWTSGLLLVALAARAELAPDAGEAASRHAASADQVFALRDSLPVHPAGTPSGRGAFGGPVFLFPESTGSGWDGILDGTAGADRLSFGVILEGQAAYRRNADRQFPPASNAKLFTALAALARLGKDARFETLLQWRASATGRPGVAAAVRLLGVGDPSWGMSEFGETAVSKIDSIAGLLGDAGVREIAGPIELVAADPRWEELELPPGYAREDSVSCYGAQAQAFNLDINCGFFVLRGPTRGGWEDAAIPVPVELRLRSGRVTSYQVISLDPPGTAARRFAITGTWASGTPAQRFYLPVNDVKGWIHNLLMKALARRGIPVRGELADEGAGEPQERVIVSPPLGELLKPLMKLSLNMPAEALFRAMGARAKAGGPSLLAAAQESMSAFLDEAGVPSAGTLLWDGSGLSRDSQVTPTAVLKLLEYGLRRSDFDVLWDSLPIAGVDGTLAKRMLRTPAQGVLRGKTGTLSGVYNLSGYVPRLHAAGGVREYVPFVMLTSGDAALKDSARGAQDRLGSAFAAKVNAIQ